MYWNRPKLKEDIMHDTMNLRQLKASVRRSGYQMSEADAAGLADAKADATLRCAIAAHIHNKIHLTNWKPPKEAERRPMTREEQAEFIGDALERYKMVPEQTQEAVA